MTHSLTPLQQVYPVSAIYKKLIYKGYEWALATEKLRNEQNILPLSPSWIC